MEKKSVSKIEKEADRAGDKIEKIELKEIQKDYKKQVPAFIWLLKILIVLGILYSLIQIFIWESLIANILVIVLSGILLYSLFKRKRWGWYYGMGLFLLVGVFNIILGNYYILVSLAYLFLIIILYWHKDYLNK